MCVGASFKKEISRRAAETQRKKKKRIARKDAKRDELVSGGNAFALELAGALRAPV